MASLQAAPARAMLANKASKLPLGQYVDALTLIRSSLCWKSKGILVDRRKVNKLSGSANGHPWHYLKGVPSPESSNSASSSQEWRLGASMYRNHRTNLLQQIQSSRWNFDSPEGQWFTNGSSFIERGTQKAEYDRVSLDEVIETKVLPPKTSVQEVELTALMSP